MPNKEFRFIKISTKNRRRFKLHNYLHTYIRLHMYVDTYVYMPKYVLSYISNLFQPTNQSKAVLGSLLT